MTTFHEKYLKYKTKYLVLKKALDVQSGGGVNLFDVSELTDTPIFINSNTQSGGKKKSENSLTLINSNTENDFLNISHLSDTPTFSGLRTGQSSSESSEIMISESSGGGSKKVKKHRKKTFNLIHDDKIKKIMSDSSTEDSTESNLSDSTESLLSSLGDSDSEL